MTIVGAIAIQLCSRITFIKNKLITEVKMQLSRTEIPDDEQRIIIGKASRLS